ncbi:MAG: CAP domain-containing protein, partial [Planctomycetota bacterium]
MPRTVGQGLAFLLGFCSALALSPFRVEIARADSNAASYEQLEARLHQEVNAVRARRHLIPLERDPALDAVARAHSADMARRGYLNHVNPEGQNPVDRLRAAGIEGFSLAAENAGLTDRDDPNREI